MYILRYVLVPFATGHASQLMKKVVAWAGFGLSALELNSSGSFPCSGFLIC